MTLAWIIFFAFLIFAIYDIKKAILVWIPAHVLTNSQVALRYASPGIAVSVAISAMLVILYYLKYSGRKSKQINPTSFVLKPVLIAMIISYLLSYIFSIVSITAQYSFTIKYFLEGFLLLYVFQRCLNDKNDMKLFIKTTFVVIILITGLGIYELLTLENPVLDYIYYNSPHNESTIGRLAYYPGFHRIRYGLPRCLSFFPIHLRFGAACVFFMFFMGVLLKRKSSYLSEQHIFIAICLLIIGVFASNSKQGLVGMVVLSCSLIHFKKLINFKYLLLILFIVFLWWQFPTIFNNLYSLFDDELAEEGGGSTIALRTEQYRVAWNMFTQNPIFGNGPGSLSYMKAFGDNAEIRGAESIFLSILPERGLLGAFVYIFMYIYLFFALKTTIPSKVLFFYLLTIFVIEVAGGRKDITLYFGMLIGAYRYFQLHNQTQ